MSVLAVGALAVFGVLFALAVFDGLLRILWPTPEEPDESSSLPRPRP